MSRLANIKPREALRAFERLGFQQVRQSGSHIIMRRGNVSFLIPRHAKDLNAELLRAIIHQAGLTVQEFLTALHGKRY